MNKTDVICLSTSPFFLRPTRKQEVVKRLPAKNVVYFNPPVTIIAPFKDKRLWKDFFGFLRRGNKASDNITVFDMPPVLPFYNKYRFINKINQFFASFYVNFRCKRAGLKNPVLWVYHPMYADIHKKIKSSHLVYDCVDRHSAYKGLINKALVDNMERELCNACSAVFCTAQGLYERLKHFNKNTFCIANGANFELFNRAASKIEPPLPLKDIPHPIFGFVGVLQECLEYSYLEHLASERKNYSIVFLGDKNADVSLEQFKKYPNVHFLKSVSQPNLPPYMANFDVCLNTFAKGELSKDVSPLKFFEYLATGKPIVSTSVPLQVLDFADAILIADQKDEFVLKCDEALGEEAKALTDKRVEYGRLCSWDARVSEISKICVNLSIIE